MLVAYSMAGLIFSVLVTVSTNIIANAIGLQFPSTIGGIVATAISGDPVSFVLMFIAVVVTGVYIWIFGFVGAKVKAKILGGNASLQTRPHVLGFFLVGALGVIAFGIIDEAIAPLGASSDALELVDDVANMQILSVLIRIVAFAVIGAVAIWLGTKFHAVESILPEKVKVI
jgi:hypothetical protein